MRIHDILKKILVSLFLAATFILLEGCNNKINLVKQGSLLDHKDLLLGDVLDSSKYFSKTKWDFFTTDQDGEIVQFTGVIKPIIVSNIREEIGQNEDYRFILEHPNWRFQDDRDLEQRLRQLEAENNTDMVKEYKFFMKEQAKAINIALSDDFWPSETDYVIQFNYQKEMKHSKLAGLQ